MNKNRLRKIVGRTLIRILCLASREMEHVGTDTPLDQFEPMNFTIRSMKPEDVDTIEAEYRSLGWGRPRESFERLLERQESGERTVFITAGSDDVYVGHVTVSFSSRNPSFNSAGIPEINDFNVLPRYRRNGIGTALLDAAESLIAEKHDVAGIGVGMTPDYGAAQRMYAKRRYVPDGRGLTKDFVPVKYRQPIIADDSLVLWMTKRLG